MRTIRSGFTLIELMIVIIIVTIIASFGFPNYDKSRARIDEKDGANNLSVIASGMTMYQARDDNREFPNVNYANAAAINNALNLAIIAQNMDYSCVSTTTTFTCTADPTAYGWTLEVDEASGGEPYCASGTCPLCTGGGCPF